MTSKREAQNARFRRFLEVVCTPFRNMASGGTPGAQKVRKCVFFCSKTIIFHIKKASIPFCFSNIFGKKTNDTVHKNRRNAIFGGKNASIAFCFFANFGKNTAGTVHNKKASIPSCFLNIFGENFLNEHAQCLEIKVSHMYFFLHALPTQ